MKLLSHGSEYFKICIRCLQLRHVHVSYFSSIKLFSEFVRTMTELFKFRVGNFSVVDDFYTNDLHKTGKSSVHIKRKAKFLMTMFVK